jgi:hypothetical protein
MMFSLVVLGIAAFGLFLFGYYQNVLADDSLGSIFQRLALPVSPIGLQITSQVLYECCFGVLLVEKFVAVLRSWCRRSPWRRELREKLREASVRYNAAEARFRQAASSLASLDTDRETFGDLVFRLVSLKWQMRHQEGENKAGLGALLDRLADAKESGEAITPEWLDFVKFARARQSEGR